MSDVKHADKRTETHECVSERTETHDLISRKAAIDFIDAGHLCNPNELRWSDNDVVNFLKKRPSAEPERHGRWIPHNENAPMFSPSYCSECGAICRNVLDKFCYQCVAKMDGDSE